MKKIPSSAKAAIAPTKTKLQRYYPWLLVIGGVIGLIAAFIITMEKLHLYTDATYQPSCSLNPVLSCGSVMQSNQAAAFGFPNPFIGLAAFAVVVTIGMAMLAGATFKRWFWLGLQAGTIFGAVFIHWLFFQSVYRIEALCIYCMIVWSVTMPIFWYTTLYNLREGHLKTPPSLQKTVTFMQQHHADLLVLWFVIIFLLIMHHFWYYFQTLLP